MCLHVVEHPSEAYLKAEQRHAMAGTCYGTLAVVHGTLYHSCAERKAQSIMFVYYTTSGSEGSPAPGPHSHQIMELS